VGLSKGVRVLGLGVDLVELDRVESSLGRWGDRLVARLMDPPEAAALPPAGMDRVRAVALSIAAKEAASKAIGTGWSRGVRWRDVVREGDSVRLLGRAGEVAARLGSSGGCRLRLEVRGNLVLAELRLLA
jgi:holo-[acyl-carrier protein] synthase